MELTGTAIRYINERSKINRDGPSWKAFQPNWNSDKERYEASSFHRECLQDEWKAAHYLEGRGKPVIAGALIAVDMIQPCGCLYDLDHDPECHLSITFPGEELSTIELEEFRLKQKNEHREIAMQLARNSVVKWR